MGIKVELTSEQVSALRALREGVKHADGYGNITDDDALFFAPGDGGTLYELACEVEQLSLGHLRDLTTILDNTVGED